MSADLTEDAVREYLLRNSGADSVAEVLGALNAPPGEENTALVADLLNAAQPETGAESAEDAETEDVNPGGEADETPPGTVRERHYARDGLVDVYRELGEKGDDQMVGKRGTYGWFRETKRYLDLGPGETAEARVYGLGADAPQFLHRAANEPMDNRSLYGTTNYVSREWLSDSWVEFTRDADGKTWHTDDGDSPMQPYEQVERFGLFVDMDLEDEAKAARYGAADADPEAFDQETVETAIRFVVARFARLAGGRNNVLVLDSGGGVYVMIPPSATRPLLETFDTGTPGRAAVVDRLGDAMNDWLTEVEREMYESIPATKGMLDFDTVNHKNRAFKAPLSLHKTYDAVVRPMDPAAPDYTALHPDDVGEEDVEAAREWAEAFTADGSTDAADLLADELLEEHPAEWDKERITPEGEILTDGDDISPQSRADVSHVDLDNEITTAVGGEVSVVTDYAALVAAVDDLDGQEVADRTIVSEWRETSGELRMFWPTWGGADCNGRANIAGSGGWKDTAAGDGGGAAKMALIAAENFSRSRDATGREFFRGVRLLRERFGFDLPLFVPEAGSPRSDGTEHDQTPGWALRKAAVAFGLIYRREFEEREADDGSTYAALPDAVYNATLDRLSEAGVAHGRDLLGDGRCAKSYLRRKEEDGEGTDEADETVAELLSAL